jgi:hypothetical protein
VRALLLAPALALTACSGDDGAVFSIAELECVPFQLLANQQTAIECDYTFRDEDLRVDMIHLDLHHPDGVTTDMLDAVFVNDEMLTGGPGYLNFNLTPNSVGTAVLAVQLRGDGDASNVEEFEFDCVSP